MMDAISLETNPLNGINAVITHMLQSWNLGNKPNLANYPNLTKNEAYQLLLLVCQSNKEAFAIELLHDEQMQNISFHNPKQVFIVAAASNNLLIANHLVKQIWFKDNIAMQNNKDFVMTGFSLLQNQEPSQLTLDFSKGFLALRGVRQHILSGEFYYLGLCCQKNLEFAGLELLNYPNIENYVANNDNFALLKSTSNGLSAMALKLLDFKNVRNMAANHNNLALMQASKQNLPAVTFELLSIPAVLKATTALPFLLNQVIRQKDENSAIRLLAPSINDFMTNAHFTAVRLNLAVSLKLDKLIQEIIRIRNVLNPDYLSVINLESYLYLLAMACKINDQALFKTILQNHFERFDYKQLATNLMNKDKLLEFLASVLAKKDGLAEKLNNKLTEEEKIEIQYFSRNHPSVVTSLIAYGNSIKNTFFKKESNGSGKQTLANIKNSSSISLK